MPTETIFNGRTGLKVAAWGVTLVAVGWFVWPFIGLVMDPQEPKLLTIFATSLTTAQPDDGSKEVSKLRRYFTRLEEVAREEGDIPLQKYGSSKFAQQVCRSQNLAEEGKYLEAAAALSALIDGSSPEK